MTLGGIVHDEGNGVQAVGGTGSHIALLVLLQHLVGIAVVSGDAQDGADFIDDLLDTSQAQVNSLHGDLGGQAGAGVAHHVAVGEVAADEAVLAALQGSNHQVGDFGGQLR